MFKRIFVQLIGFCGVGVLLCFAVHAQAQNDNSPENLPKNVKETVRLLLNNYENYRENSLKDRRFKNADIQPLLQKAEKEYGFEVKLIGKSIENRPIHLVRIGTGETSVFLWSQMHGNEPTATGAVFDIFNFFGKPNELDSLKKEILGKVSLYFIPMLNPDGAERFSRYNAVGIDLNRDARRLSSPESQLLKHIRDSLDADWGFNLHDQGRHHATQRNNPATISFLAPPFNSKRSVNKTRQDAMQLIGELNELLSEYIPQRIGRYYDGYNARAFGDNIQKWGTATILVESGAYPKDPERQFVRKMNFGLLMGGFISIARKNYEKYSTASYKKIPSNRSVLKDVRLKKLTFRIFDTDILTDITINRQEIQYNENRDFYYQGSIENVGELFMYHGHSDINCTGLRAEFGKVFRREYSSLEEMKELNFKSLLSNGYTAIRLRVKSGKPQNYVEIPPKNRSGIPEFSPFPCNIVVNDAEEPKAVNLDENPSFVIYKGKEVKYILVNGFLYDPKKDDPENVIYNGIVFE